MCLWLKSVTAQDCSAIIVRMKIVPSSGAPCHLLAGLFHHNTKHHLDSTTFSKTTLYTEHYFQNLCSRQAALTNRSRTSITSGRNPRNTSPTGYEPTELATISESSLEDIYLLYDVQRIWRTRSTSSKKEFGQIGDTNWTNGRGVTFLRRCLNSNRRYIWTSLWKALLLILKMESYKRC